MPTGIALGRAIVTVSAAGLSEDFVVAVRSPSFEDDFAVDHNYLTDGFTNTLWDGIYAQPGAVPGSNWKSHPDAATIAADANLSSNGTLTVANRDVGWDWAQNDGFFLFKYVTDDFQVAVHLSSMDITPFNLPGILARPYAFSADGQPGPPFGGTNGESWIAWARFDEFAIGTYARLVITNAERQDPQEDYLEQRNWLLMVRRNGTNFTFYTRARQTEPWHPSPSNTIYSVPLFAGVPMQVGLEAGGFNTNVATARFSSFMLDVGPPLLTVQRLNPSLISVSWPAAWTGTTLERSPLLGTEASWLPVGQTPTRVCGIQSVTVPLTGEQTYFRLKR